MSWNVEIIGERANVAAAVQAEPHIPQCLKDVVKAVCEEGKSEPNAPQGMRVKTSCHFGDAWSNVTEFSVNYVTFAKPPAG